MYDSKCRLNKKNVLFILCIMIALESEEQIWNPVFVHVVGLFNANPDLLVMLNSKNIWLLTKFGRKTLLRRLWKNELLDNTFTTYAHPCSYVVCVKSEKDLASIIKTIDKFMLVQTNKREKVDNWTSVNIFGIENMWDGSYVIIWPMYGDNVEWPKVIEKLNSIFTEMMYPALS